MSVKGLCRKAALAFAALVWIGSAAGVARAEDVNLQLTPEAARQMVRQALQIGNAGLAAQISQQLVDANPADMQARLLLTAALARSGQAEKAIALGRENFRLANTADLRFQSAFVTSEALAKAGKPGVAKWWLRLADSNRTNAADQALLKNAFAALDSQTPLKLNITLNAGPSNNVNGGSLKDSFDFWGIPIPIAQALPGYSGTASARLSYRLVSRNDRELTLFARATKREVWLSDQAHRVDPLAKASDYSNAGLDLGASYRLRVADTVEANFDGRIGRRWYGSGAQTEVQRLGFGLSKALPGSRFAGFDLSVEATQYPTASRANLIRTAAEVSLATPFAGGRLRGSFGLTEVSSAQPGVAYHAVSLGVDLAPRQIVPGLDLAFFAEAQAKDYWQTFGSTPDYLLEAGATAKLPNLSVMGFTPTTTLSASRSLSPVVVRDTFDLGISLGISSSF